jgi:hypothetical protein
MVMIVKGEARIIVAEDYLPMETRKAFTMFPLLLLRVPAVTGFPGHADFRGIQLLLHLGDLGGILFTG